jgi:hypothetical protein
MPRNRCRRPCLLLRCSLADWSVRGNTVVTASSNHDAFYSGREKGLEIAWLMKGVEFYVSDSHDHDDGCKSNQYNENPEPHLVDSALESYPET